MVIDVIKRHRRACIMFNSRGRFLVFSAVQRFYINFPFESSTQSKNRSIFCLLGHRNFFVSSRFRCINKCSSVRFIFFRSDYREKKISLQTTRDDKNLFCFNIYVQLWTASGEFRAQIIIHTCDAGRRRMKLFGNCR